MGRLLVVGQVRCEEAHSQETATVARMRFSGISKSLLLSKRIHISCAGNHTFPKRSGVSMSALEERYSGFQDYERKKTM